ncbi:hypothetical protein FQN57_006710 [Myotisia sp. PD_48]|nr:hypothetical protein FQN57_006710 [Myotisia sp. PD_48]
MAPITTEFISAGGNRNPEAADWHRQSGLLAFGAHNNVAIWNPADQNKNGVYTLLAGHSSTVNAVKFFTSPTDGSPLLITGSVDRSIRIWKPDASNPPRFSEACALKGHEGSINCIGIAEGSDVWVSGAADGTVKAWKIIQEDGIIQCSLLQTIALQPRCLPLTLALKLLLNPDATSVVKGMVLAVGGTSNKVQVFSAQRYDDLKFELSATLSGHENWIRSLSFTPASANIGSIDVSAKASDFLLASASQDKYIRLWRVSAGERLPSKLENVEEKILGGLDQLTLSPKTHRIDVADMKYSITFEALLLGHEDWVYTVAWSPNLEKPQLLSSSADSSLVIWEQDPITGVWFSLSRMGEISVLKGATTATGSAGGFWVGLWAPTGKMVVCLGRTGSWRAWEYDTDADMWRPMLGVTGHVKAVMDLAWEAEGGYLLSTSSDQTTRLYSEWKKGAHHSWHEFSRPQIHGYDLNCLASLGSARFVSGADEKLLRVFNEPKAVANLLSQLCGLSEPSGDQNLPEAASIPVLGLSNKAVDEDVGGENGTDAELQPSEQVFDLTCDHPPLEDYLARHTLWPEHEKLYGHGYEISAVTASHDRSIIATACKASSIDHAVIRLYDTSTWNEIRPALTAHSLTITALRFSPDDRYLLSAGRDRQWAVFERDSTNKLLYQSITSNPKGHSRMILSASWAPHPTSRVFATAGRDKTIKIWVCDGASYTAKTSIPVSSPVTAIDFFPSIAHGGLYLAVGDDTGQISIQRLEVNGLAAGKTVIIPKSDCPSLAITQLAWRPRSTLELGEESGGTERTPRCQLAAASEDASVRIYNIKSLPA